MAAIIGVELEEENATIVLGKSLAFYCFDYIESQSDIKLLILKKNSDYVLLKLLNPI
jgi:hypothetical protein